MSILIDIPQIAYKTMLIEYIIRDNDGNRDYFAEYEAEEDLKRHLSEYRFSTEHDHVK